MQQLPSSEVQTAASMLSAGWRAAEDRGYLSPPSGDQNAGQHLVPDGTWRALALMQLATSGPVGDVSAGDPRQAIGPSFEPGSGWYRAGQWTPSSAAAIKAMREAAVPATVVVLRRRGVRIPAAELLRAEPPSGLLLCMDQYTHPNWYACLFAPDMKTERLPRLMHARLERENEGVRLYGGLEIERHDEFRQAWLCAPSPERARKILLAMLEQQGGSV